MPWWGMPFALLLPVIYTVPVSYVYAMTGQSVGINLVAEIIPGTLIAGQPLPNMVSLDQRMMKSSDCGLDFQSLFGSELVRGDHICAGPQVGALYQGCAPCDVYGPDGRNVYLCMCPNWSQAMVVQQHPRPVFTDAKAAASLSPQPGVLYRLGRLVRLLGSWLID